MPIELFGDACPVKDEVYRVAGQHGLKTYVVANSFTRVPREPLIEFELVSAGPDAADDWIAERVTSASVVVTNDIPLAARCVKAGCRRDLSRTQALHRSLDRHGARRRPRRIGHLGSDGPGRTEVPWWQSPIARHSGRKARSQVCGPPGTPPARVWSGSGRAGRWHCRHDG
jgi:hypothetical protein